VYALQKYIMQFGLFVCGGMVPTRVWSRRSYSLLSVLCRLPKLIRRRQRQLFLDDYLLFINPFSALTLLIR